jgi:glycosyltransferase involved in cell wall biosynthesis
VISVLLAAYKSGELIRKVFLPGFVENSKEEVELIIYDNGNSGEDWKHICTGLALFEHDGLEANIRVVGDGKNIGLNAALNECAKVARGDWFYLPHTDMYLMPGWDTALLEAAKNIPPHQALLCSRSIEKNSHIPTQLIRDFGTDIASFKEKELYEFFKTYDDNGIVTSYRMPFFMHRRLWDVMTQFNKKNGYGDGGVDDWYFSYATDNDLFFTAHKVGVRRFWMVNSSVVYHLSGHSNNQQSVDKDSDKPYRYLIDKWQKFGYDVSMNIDASEQNLVPWGIKVK